MLDIRQELTSLLEEGSDLYRGEVIIRGKKYDIEVMWLACPSAFEFFEWFANPSNLRRRMAGLRVANFPPTPEGQKLEARPPCC